MPGAGADVHKTTGGFVPRAANWRMVPLLFASSPPLTMKPIGGSRLGSLENQLEPHIQTLRVPRGRHLLPGGRGLLDGRQARRPAACGSLDFRPLADMDCVAAPVSDARPVYCAGSCS